MLPAGSGENVEKWAILLPQEELAEGEEGSAYSEDGNYTGIRPEIPTITENGYLAEGITMILDVGTAPVGAINGLFTINENGDQVYFSQGNLQYIGNASTPYWKFADNQWDYYGDNGQADSDIHIVRDLFGWGTSGWDCGNTYFEPWNIHYQEIGSGNSILDRSYCYGPQGDNDLTGVYANSDWGVYNAISNGGNQNGQWRTLTNEEWNYVFNIRNSPSGIRYAKAIVNDINGVILLPDNWSSSIYQLYDNTNENWAEFNSNVIDASQWYVLQNEGAVFLPATGIRLNNSHSSGWTYYITVDISNVNNTGVYWSAESFSTSAAYRLFFDNNSCNSSSAASRGVGCSVRLVQDYNP